MRLALVIALSARSALALAEEGATALLPVEGQPGLVTRVEGGLSAALARRRTPLLAPEALSRKLLAAPAVTRALAAAARDLKRSDAALLRMRRPAAVAAARQAIAALESVGGRFHSRPELARACETLARALLLRPADEAAAATAIARAVAIAPDHAADPDRSPPRLRALLEEARRQARPTVAPAGAALAPVAASAGVERLLWLSVQRAGQEVELELVLFSKDGKVARRERRRLPEAGLLDGAADRIASFLGSPAIAPPAVATAPGPGRAPAAASTPAPTPVPATASSAAPPAEQARPPAARLSTPWYKRWWVWTLCGVVVTGAAVGLGVGLSQQSSSSGWEIAFSF